MLVSTFALSPTGTVTDRWTAFLNDHIVRLFPHLSDYSFALATEILPKFSLGSVFDDQAIRAAIVNVINGLRDRYLEGVLIVNPHLERLVTTTIYIPAQSRSSWLDQATSVPEPTVCDIPSNLIQFSRATAIRGQLFDDAIELQEDKFGMSVTPATIDFGKHAVDDTLKAKEMTRSAAITNRGPAPVLLLDILCEPKGSSTFHVTDDYCVAEGSGACVVLHPNSTYNVTIRMKTNDVGVHQQWLVFLCVPGFPSLIRRFDELGYVNDKELIRTVEARPSGNGGPIARGRRKGVAPPALTKEGEIKALSECIFGVGRRVTVCIQPPKSTMKQLSSDAPPFIPGELRMLFDQQPAAFYLCSGSDYYPECIGSLLPAMQVAPVTASVLLNDVHRPTDPLSPLAVHLRKLGRLLALEEVAMLRDIRMYDLHFATLAVTGKQFLTNQTGQPTIVINVPGLPENRPPLFIGACIYVRDDSVRNVEYCGRVIDARVAQALVYVVMPYQFHEAYHLEHLLYSSNAEEVDLNPKFHVRFSVDQVSISHMITASVSAQSNDSLLPTLRPDLCEPFRELTTEQRVFTPQHTTMYNADLNFQQRKAVCDVLNGASGPFASVIFGPPGTGKTVTMVETALQLLDKKSHRILMCAPSNSAADLLCSKMASRFEPGVMIRVNDPRRHPATVREDVVPYCRGFLQDGFYRAPLHSELDKARVIVVTCSGAATLPYSLMKTFADPISYILIDEAAQALELEVLIPIRMFPSARLVLAGDPYQLGPVVHSAEALNRGMGTSLLGRLLPTLRGTDACTKLVHNYRSHASLLELFSRLFYNSELIASAKPEITDRCINWPGLPKRGFPFLFEGVNGQQLREGDSPSFFNLLEAVRVAEYVKALLADGLDVSDIGVLAPFRRQVQKIRLLLRSLGLGKVRVGTVDDYQGQEERVIIISTVITRPQTLLGGGDSSFMQNPRRFNVAISRAQSLLIVIGHPTLLMNDFHWRKLLEYAVDNGAYVGESCPLLPGDISVEEQTLRTAAAFSLLHADRTDFVAGRDDITVEETGWRVL